MGLLGSSPIPRSFAASCVSFQLRPLPSTGITRLHQSYGPLRHPRRPGLALASCQLIASATTARASRVASGPLFACMPSLIPRQVWWNLFARTVPSASAFPRLSAGRLLHCPFRGLLSVHSRYGLHARQVTKVTLYTGGSDGFVASAAAPIATEWSEPVLGRGFHPQWTSAFHGAR